MQNGVLAMVAVLAMLLQACMVESYVVQSPSLMPSSVLSARSGTGSALFNRGFPISRRSVTQETGLQNRGGVRGGGILELQCQQKGVEKGFNVLELTGALVPQGVLVKGVKTAWNQAWKTLMKELAPQSKDGSYVRPSYSFDGYIGKHPKKTGGKAFPDQAGRYQLYVGTACPWCHRCELVRSVRGLDRYLAVTRVLDRPEEASRGGWVFTPTDPDPLKGARDLRELYDALVPGGYRGRCTAPLLADKAGQAIVSNESADIMRMLNNVGSFKEGEAVDLVPSELEAEIDAMNQWIYEDINNGVYKCGFSTTQQAYDRAQAGLNGALDKVEKLLGERRFLLGDKITEADLRLFPTIIRYDGVYNTLFKCTGRRVSMLPNLSGWLRDVYQAPGVEGCCDLAGMRESYYQQLFPLNPSAIVPSPPPSSLLDPPDRGPQGTEHVFHYK